MITLNGMETPALRGRTLLDAVTGTCATTDGVAAAVNLRVVPRHQWASTTLTDGDAVDVVTATQGG